MKTNSIGFFLNAIAVGLNAYYAINDIYNNENPSLPVGLFLINLLVAIYCLVKVSKEPEENENESTPQS